MDQGSASEVPKPEGEEGNKPARVPSPGESPPRQKVRFNDDDVEKSARLHAMMEKLESMYADQQEKSRKQFASSEKMVQQMRDLRNMIATIQQQQHDTNKRVDDLHDRMNR